ncbi:hypothetical protein SLEP1_g49953 [Rubroshorea leprosula]|uniref:Retrotransposon Copia-like N-terminal domain-containing protein n=1 Tax=Rubroshorea leprosula TaxID=152421 RepID=A0AAV5LZA0_9ROSI|nr:hypothetical protein SLEP1_g49953 [Rubroshorea leprosula]
MLPSPTIKTPGFSSLVSPVFSHPVFTISNIKNLVPETLNHQNFTLWRELMIPVFNSKGVFGHIDGTDPCPLPGDLMFEAWTQIDYQILSWIQATISSEVLQMIIQPRKSLSAKEAWDAIHVAHPNQLDAQALFLQQDFSSIHRDVVFQVLAGLDSDYNVAKRTIPQRVPFPSFLELHSLLLIEEVSVQREKGTISQQLLPDASQVLQATVQPSPQSSTAVPMSSYQIHATNVAPRSDFLGFSRANGRGFPRGGRRGSRGG